MRRSASLTGPRKTVPHRPEGAAADIWVCLEDTLLSSRENFNLKPFFRSFPLLEITTCLSRYHLAQQQLREMKKKGLKEATQLYHVSSSPVHDTVLGTAASPTNIPTSTGFAHPTLRGDAGHSPFGIATPISELPSATSRVTPVELVLGPSAHASGGSSKWRERTAEWVEMVERSGSAGFRGRGEGEAGQRNSFNNNPNFRRTSSFNDTRPQPLSSVHSRPFRERSMTQVNYPAFIFVFTCC